MSTTPNSEKDKVVPLPSTGPPSYKATPSEPPTPHPEPEQPNCAGRRYRRFCHFLAAALFVWFTGRFIIRHCELRKFGPHHRLWGSAAEHGEHPPRPGESIHACVDSANWTEYDPGKVHNPHKFDVWRRAELSLPSTSDDIFLFSRAIYTAGVLHITEVTGRDDIGVEVIVGFHENNHLFERTKVCTLHRGDNGHGVGIFAHPFKRHDRPRHRDLLFFNVTVLLPEGANITTIPHFETHLPLFRQVVTRLPKHTFGSISLHSSHSPILAESLVSNKVRIHSRNGPVGGTFNTSSSISIKTVNSPVNVTVNALNKDNATPTKVKIHTKNGFLSAHLALLSAHENQTNGVFIVHTRTSNSPLALSFTEQPPDSLLKLEAHTSNAPTHVRLHPSFEGIFKLRTSIFPAFVSADPDVEDPAGRGRKRVVNVKTIGRGARIVHGDVTWVPQEERVAPAGKVDVSTTNSPLGLWL